MKVRPSSVRVAPSFIRFGNFQLHTWRDETDHLRALADHTIRHHFADLAPGDVAGIYAEVVRRTALLMVEWARVGFVHGVMNTDNMSILGLTIDYEPYGWLEGYDPGWTPNTTDAQERRCRFGNQPAIAQWNLAQLGNALVPCSTRWRAAPGSSRRVRHHLRERLAVDDGLQART